jgi:hypothetical protein
VSSLTVFLRDKTAIGKNFQSVPNNKGFHAAVLDVVFDFSRQTGWKNCTRIEKGNGVFVSTTNSVCALSGGTKMCTAIVILSCDSKWRREVLR